MPWHPDMPRMHRTDRLIVRRIAMTPRFNDDSPATTAVATRHLATMVTLAFHAEKLQVISLEFVSVEFVSLQFVSLGFVSLEFDSLPVLSLNSMLPIS